MTNNTRRTAASNHALQATAADKKGKFIVFEGTDGCGKTTQVELLRRKIESLVGPCLAEREPDSRNIVGAVIRTALYGGVKILPESMAYLHVADRFEHVEHMLGLLNSGKNIVCDRYYISNMAYNATDALSMRDIYELNRPCIARLAPDAVIYLDVPEAVTRARREAARSDTEIYDATEKQLAVANNFRRAIEMLRESGEPTRFCTVDASQSIDDVAAAVWNAVKDLFAPSKAEK